MALNACLPMDKVSQLETEPNLPQPEAPVVTKNENVPSGVLENVRDHLARFQEARGVSRTNYGFVTLVTAILTMLVQSMQSLLSLLMALAPVSEISLHVVRFALERVIDIKNTSEMNVAIRKGLVFLSQLVLILCFISFVFGSILIPVSRMGLSVFGVLKLITSLLFV